MRRLLPVLAVLFLLLAWVAPVERARAGTPPGPPYPAPVNGQSVYDTAGLLSQATIAQAEAIIDAIEVRTGAEAVVYTQVKPGATFDSTEQDAIDLINQWGVGRKGFDDGLAILMNVYTGSDGLVHGQVQLYAAPGFRDLYLTNQERQRIYEEEMKPLLLDQRFDDAVLVALQRVDVAATAEKAAQLQLGRQVDAVIGIVGGLGSFLLLTAWTFFYWRRYGRDPYVADSPSIYLPAPPPELTAAGGALLHDGQSSRRTLTAAMLDLASRDEIAFRETRHLLGHPEVTVEIHEPRLDDPRIRLNRRNPISPAEEYALGHLNAESLMESSGIRTLDRGRLLEFGKSVPGFDQALEEELVGRGWFTGLPGAVTKRWRLVGTAELIAAGIAFWAGQSIPSGGFTLLAIGLGAAGVCAFLLAQVMPARTLSGATLKAMLAAYRRSLEAALFGARSMDQVVADPRLPWLETPDRAIVWSVALGLQGPAEEVLKRSMEDLRAGRVGSAYLPAWYGAHGGGDADGGAGGFAPGVMSSSPIPNLGGMMAALGTIGNSPSSGGGGFGGGGGGGGGGAGGGF
jgi:uncharacterized membrane protein YgcG